MAKLLLVDDDSELLEIFAEVLRVEGHVVRVANHGEDGVRALREEHPDLILCDVEMPLLDGPAMAYRIFIQNAGAEKIPIVLTSGVADLDRVASDRVGTPYYVPKPFTFEQLSAVLTRALADRLPPAPRPES